MIQQIRCDPQFARDWYCINRTRIIEMESNDGWYYFSDDCHFLIGPYTTDKLAQKALFRDKFQEHKKVRSN